MDNTINTLRTLFESIREGLGVRATIGLFLDEDRLYMQIGFRNLGRKNGPSPYTIEITNEIIEMPIENLKASVTDDCLERLKV